MLSRLGRLFSQIDDGEIRPSALSWRPLILPVMLAAVVVLLNMQWMEIYQLINAPQADSLVYLSEAYRDYWLLRDQGMAALVAKYAVVGGQQTSPMLWWGGMAFFLLFGLDPAHAYWFIAVGYIGWVVGTMFLAKQIRDDGHFVVAAGLFAAVLPSAVSHGLRSFMVDFVAAVPFVWATAFLLKSQLLSRRREALVYGLLCGITVLFRTTIMPFFLAHAAIVLLVAKKQGKKINWGNASLAIAVGVVASAWFLLPNAKRIVEYYGYWAKVAGTTQAGGSFTDNLAFYLGLLPFYHLTLPVFIIGAVLSMLALGMHLARHFVVAGGGATKTADTATGLFILLAMGLVPMLVLSMYPSRASSVDFPYIAAFLLMPPLLWRMVFPRNTVAYWAVLSIPLVAMFAQQGQLLLHAPSRSVIPGDYRERDAIKIILSDADRRGLGDILLGNTAIHQHNSLSYQYWVLANQFPHWRGRVGGVSIGRTDSAEELARMNAKADYVIALDGYKENTHPNNRVAPEANHLLQARYGMKALPESLSLPDGTVLRILAKDTSASYPQADADGWHENGVRIKVGNPNKTDLSLIVSGTLYRDMTGTGPAVVTIAPLGKTGGAIKVEVDSMAFSHVFQLPKVFFDAHGNAEFVLTSSWAATPTSYRMTGDARALAFQGLKVRAEKNIE